MKKYVQGYYRGADETEPKADFVPQQPNALPAFILLSTVVLVMALMLWQVTLTIAATSGAMIAAKKAYANYQVRQATGTPVRYLNGKVRMI